MSSRRTDIDNSDIHFMYEVEGMTQQEIADYYGVSQQCIYWRLHPDKKKDNSNQWYLKNLEYAKEYYQDHSEEIKEQSKQWRLEHPEYNKETSKQWRLEHPEYVKTWRRDTDKGRASVINNHAKHRSLGSIELNKPFLGSEGHHIDNEHIIHIPSELHHSIYHNVWTGQGMEEINTIAFQYITEEMFDKLMMGEI